MPSHPTFNIPADIAGTEWEPVMGDLLDCDRRLARLEAFIAQFPEDPEE